jgi:hypothetical protein
MKTSIVPSEIIENKVLQIRKQKVMLDKDLAELYGVETRALIQAVKRNKERFPKDFMFQINNSEFNTLKSQLVISKRGGTRKLPYAFTEQGVSMLSGILRSPRAVNVNISIMRTFVKIRKLTYSYKVLSEKLNKLESKFDKKNKKQDEKVKEIFGLLDYLIKKSNK